MQNSQACQAFIGFVKKVLWIYICPIKLPIVDQIIMPYNKTEAHIVEAHFHAFLSTQQEDGICAMI